MKRQIHWMAPFVNLSGGSLELTEVTVADECQIIVQAQSKSNEACDVDGSIDSYDVDDVEACIITNSAFA